MQGSSPHHRCVSSLSLVSSLSHLVRVASQVPHPYHGEDSPLRTTSIVSTCLWWSGGGSRRDPSKNSLSLAPSLSLSLVFTTQVLFWWTVGWQDQLDGEGHTAGKDRRSKMWEALRLAKWWVDRGYHVDDMTL